MGGRGEGEGEQGEVEKTTYSYQALLGIFFLATSVRRRCQTPATAAAHKFIKTKNASPYNCRVYVVPGVCSSRALPKRRAVHQVC